MTLRKRLAVLQAALTQAWHEHRCQCGETWFCMTAVCAKEHQPVHDICAGCEGPQRAYWEKVYQLKYPRRAN
jgi:hypothetical protein